MAGCAAIGIFVVALIVLAAVLQVLGVIRIEIGCSDDDDC